VFGVVIIVIVMLLLLLLMTAFGRRVKTTAAGTSTIAIRRCLFGQPAAAAYIIITIYF